MHAFRSLWGSTEPFDVLFPKLAKLGFAGVEASLEDTGYPNSTPFFDALSKSNLKWIAGAYSSWDDYKGEPVRLSIEGQLKQFNTQLGVISKMPILPVKVNAHCKFISSYT
jgi:hypothetical protein